MQKNAMKKMKRKIFFLLDFFRQISYNEFVKLKNKYVPVAHLDRASLS